MDILVTGGDGFVGRNLTAALQALRKGNDPTRPGLQIGAVYTFCRSTEPSLLEKYCRKADFIFHLAGVNRAAQEEAFHTGNTALTKTLLDYLRQHKNPCPVLLASSIHAGRDDPYGRSKLAAEQLVFDHARQTGAAPLVYRLPNLFGKWCRPDYNSVIATFCHNIARDLPIRLEQPQRVLELAYIDDVVQELLNALQGHPHRCGDHCTIPVTHQATPEEIARMLEAFQEAVNSGRIPLLEEGSFAKKLYATYLSCLPPEKICRSIPVHRDGRGSFAQLLQPERCGQFSVNITKPGMTKGQHWHHSKWELFFVISGEGLIRQRRLYTGEVLEFPVSGVTPQAVYILPGYAHSLVNTSKTEDLITLMWASEPFDPQKTDTYPGEVETCSETTEN